MSGIMGISRSGTGIPHAASFYPVERKINTVSDIRETFLPWKRPG